MNKKANLHTIGMILFIGSLLVFVIYCLYVYIPALTSDVTNPDAVLNAVWWGIGCGIFGTIGLILAKQ